VDLAVVENGRIYEFSQLEGIQFLAINFLEFGCRTDVDGVVDLGDSFVEVLDFDVNVVLAFRDFHHSVDASMVALHEFDVVVFVLEQIGFELTGDALFGENSAFIVVGLRLYLGQEIFDVGPSFSVVALDELGSLAAFLVLDIEVEEAIL
jgi:hypothetical protein